jgi:hypothetical protein
MNDILNKSTVLVLNRHWQAIHVKTPAEAFCMIATGAATALDVQADDYTTPLPWDDWLKLPVREHDNAVNTPRGPVRMPTVIVAAIYAKAPPRHPRFGARGIWERDGGVCQYIGRKLSPNEGNIVPRSRGGKTRCDACGPIYPGGPARQGEPAGGVLLRASGAGSGLHDASTHSRQRNRRPEKAGQSRTKKLRFGAFLCAIDKSSFA